MRGDQETIGSVVLVLIVLVLILGVYYLMMQLQQLYAPQGDEEVIIRPLLLIRLEVNDSNVVATVSNPNGRSVPANFSLYVRQNGEVVEHYRGTSGCGAYVPAEGRCTVVFDTNLPAGTYEIEVLVNGVRTYPVVDTTITIVPSGSVTGGQGITFARWPLVRYDTEGTNTIPSTTTGGGGPRVRALHEYRTPLKLYTPYYVTADLDNDGLDEIVMATEVAKTSEVTVMEANGDMLWRYTLSSPPYSAPTVWDLEGDGVIEVIVVDGSGQLIVLGEGGILKWSTTLGGFVYGAPIAADLEGDGVYEVIVHATDDNLYVFGADGVLKWRSPARRNFGFYETDVSVGDINGDGVLEIAVLTDTNLILFDANGNVLWWYDYPVGRTASKPAVFYDLGGVGDWIVLTLDDANILVLDGSGNIVTSYKPPTVSSSASVTTSPAVGDVEGDGNPEILLVTVGNSTRDSNLYLLRFDTTASTISLLGEVFLGASSLTPVLADLTGDGNLEVTVSLYSNEVAVYTIGGGSLLPLWRYSLGDFSLYQVVPAEVDGDGRLELVVATADFGVITLDTNDLGRGGATAGRLPSVYRPSPTYMVDISRKNSFHTGLNGIGTSISLKWSLGTGTPSDVNAVDSTPVYVDIDEDYNLEVIVGGWDGNLYVVGNTGTVERVFTVGYPILSTPTVADLDEDHKLEIIFGAEDNVLRVLENNMGVLWSYTVGGPIRTSPAVWDIDGDGNLEVVFGSLDGNLYVLSPIGVLEWYLPIDVGGSSPAVGDVDSDGLGEVVVGSTDGNIYVVGHNGAVEWRFSTGGTADVTPVLYDVDWDGNIEIIAGTREGNLYVLEVGRVEWSTTLGPALSPASVGDLDDDGNVEIVVVMENNVYALENNGVVFWTQTKIPVGGAPALLFNIENSTGLDVVVSGLDGNIYVIDGATGNPLRLVTAGLRIDTPPVVFCVDPFASVEGCGFVVHDSDGNIYAYTTSAQLIAA